jgi:hypothetical protein
VIGGAFPQGGALAALSGHYVFADFEDDPPYGDILALGLDAGRTGVVGEPIVIVENADGPVDLVIGPDGALYYVSLLAGAVRRVAGEGGVACTDLATCQAALAGVLPDPDTAADKKARKAAKKLGKLDGKADGKLAKAAAATGKKQAKLYAKARKTLEKLLAAARTADEKGKLGVALATIEGAVNALLAFIPQA